MPTPSSTGSGSRPGSRISRMFDAGADQHAAGGDQHDLVFSVTSSGRPPCRCGRWILIAMTPLVPRPWRKSASDRRALAEAVLGRGRARSARRRRPAWQSPLVLSSSIMPRAAGRTTHRTHVVPRRTRPALPASGTASRRATGVGDRHADQVVAVVQPTAMMPALRGLEKSVSGVFLTVPWRWP